MNDYVPVASIRAFLLIENRLLREALVRLLRKRPDIVVAGQSSPSDETSVGILDTQCNVLVSDSFVPGLLPASLSTKIGALAGFKIILIGMDSEKNDSSPPCVGAQPAICCRMHPHRTSLLPCVPCFAARPCVLRCFAPLCSASWLKRPMTCVAKTQLRSRTLLCVNSNWSH